MALPISKRTLQQRAMETQANALSDRSIAEREQLDAGIHQLGTDESLANTATEARGVANEMFDAQMGAVEREQRALGGLTERQAMGQRKQIGLRRSLAEVGMANRAIVNEQDLNTAVGEMAFDRRAMFEDMSLGLGGQAADIENQRNIRRKLKQASGFASKLGVAGTVIGLGAAAFTGGASLALAAPSVMGKG